MSLVKHTQKRKEHKPNPEFRREKVEEAVKALFAHAEREQERKLEQRKPGEKRDLFEDEPVNDSYLLTISLMKTPAQQRTKPSLIPLKHSLHANDSSRLCVIVKDPQEAMKKKLGQCPVAQVHKVYGVSKLREKFPQFQDKRDLLARYDLFLADARVLRLLPPLLGKSFFKKKKQPLAVDLSGGAEACKRSIERARDSTALFINTGACCALRIGTTALGWESVVDNIMTAIEPTVAKLPRGWRNVQAVHVKTQASVALPLFNALPPREEAAATGAKRPAPEDVKQRKPRAKKRKRT